MKAPSDITKFEVSTRKDLGINDDELQVKFSRIFDGFEGRDFDSSSNLCFQLTFRMFSAHLHLTYLMR